MSQRKNIQYTIGCDPELFLITKDGKFRSAHTSLPGTKTDPFQVDNGMIQVDGVAAEFNTLPATTVEDFQRNIRSVLRQMQRMIHEKHPSFELIATPVAKFDARYFRGLPKAAKLLGCEPDYNAYTEEANPSPKTNRPMRTGAGHIHVGWTVGVGANDQAHVYDCIQATRQLDAVLYPMSLLWDPDNERRTLYGKVGCYRPKHYGVEYRPLSNAWVADPDLHGWIFDSAVHAMTLLDTLDSDIQRDPFAFNTVWEARQGKEQSRTRLLEYHDYLVEEFLFKPLPEAYRQNQPRGANA